MSKANKDKKIMDNVNAMGKTFEADLRFNKFLEKLDLKYNAYIYDLDLFLSRS